jgi:hypothetical protein
MVARDADAYIVISDLATKHAFEMLASR